LSNHDTAQDTDGINVQPFSKPTAAILAAWHWRKLQKGGKAEHITIIPESGEYKEALERFYALYRSRWNHSTRQFYQFLEKFISRSHGKGWIRMDFLNVDGKNVAALYHLKYLDTLYMYLVAVDRVFNAKISIGNILVGLCLQRAAEDKIATYDFLRGHEQYKFHWANGGRRLLDLLLYQKRFGVLWLVLKRMVREIAKIFVR
jgi:CelD/BcsL family acetyltransferase involved in cellulose biosynthesis